MEDVDMMEPRQHAAQAGDARFDRPLVRRLPEGFDRGVIRRTKQSERGGVGVSQRVDVILVAHDDPGGRGDVGELAGLIDHALAIRLVRRRRRAFSCPDANRRCQSVLAVSITAGKVAASSSPRRTYDPYASTLNPASNVVARTSRALEKSPGGT